MNIYLEFLKSIKKVISSFSINNDKDLTINSLNDGFNHTAPKHNIPDVATLEQTMFVLQRVRSVFDFAPSISLVPEMRIINKGLSHLYNPSKTQSSLDDKNDVLQEVSNVVQKFSHILPEIEFLLAKIKNLPTNNTNITQAEDIKKQITNALKKVSYDKNSLTSFDYNQETHNINYNISYD